MKEIPLTQGKVALVDDADYAEMSKCRWHLLVAPSRLFYAQRRVRPIKPGRQVVVLMHRAILGIPPGMETDHINGNGLDNRRENLRVVTHRQNGQNIHVSKSSRFPGVDLDKRTGKWRAQIQVGGKRHYLGLFFDEIEAATAYQVACVVSNEGTCLNLTICTKEMKERKEREYENYRCNCGVVAPCSNHHTGTGCRNKGTIV